MQRKWWLGGEGWSRLEQPKAEAVFVLACAVVCTLLQSCIYAFAQLGELADCLVHTLMLWMVTGGDCLCCLVCLWWR
jgi:hypothetical protein